MGKSPARIPDTEAVLAYVAGIIDGEGYIGINKQKPRRTGQEHPEALRTRNAFYRLCLEVKQTDARLVAFLVRELGGYSRQEIRHTVNNRPVYVWSLQGTDAGKLLETLRPFMICKQEQVDIASRYRASFGTVYTNPCTPPEVVAFREQCYLDLKAIHGQYSGRARP